MFTNRNARRSAIALIICAAVALALPGLLTGTKSIEIAPEQIVPIDGKAYEFELPLPVWLSSPEDNADKPPQSRLVLEEDGTPLPLPHALPADIERFAPGQFAHRDGRVIFSASDGSDPRSNGRRYRATTPVGPAAFLYFPAGLCIVGFLAFLLSDKGLRPVKAPFITGRKRLAQSTAIAGGLFIFVALLHYTPPSNVPWISGSYASSKLAGLREIPEARRVVLVGDSFTVFGLQPTSLNKCLGIPVINAAIIGNWFPGQRSYNAALAKVLGPDTLVLWSINEVLMSTDETFPRFPIGPAEAVADFLHGYPPEQLAQEIGAHWPTAQFIAAAPQIKQSVLEIADTELTSGKRPEPETIVPEDWKDAQAAYLESSRRQEIERRAESVLQRLANDPNVVGADVHRDDRDLPHSIDARDRFGGRTRIEIIPEYHRLVQTQEERLLDPEILPRHHWSFKDGMRRFSESGAQVAVNILSLSPSHYGDPAKRSEWRETLMVTAKEVAAPTGSTVIDLQMDDLGDALFFDYGHLNQKGATIVSERLCRAIAPLVRGN